MIYDHAMTLCSLDAGTLIQKKLLPVCVHLYAEKEVYHSRYWESVQAGSRIDRLVQLPRMPDDEISSSQYCILEDNHVYRIEQIQRGIDDGGLDVYILSLSRQEMNYDIARP